MRKTKNLNDRWQFTGPDGGTVSVNLPHTWNSVDGQDGGNNYWRGSCRYERELDMPEFQKGEERVYLEFRGVNASARVCFNDTLVCTHDGGYSTFRVDVTLIQKCLHSEKKLVIVWRISTKKREMA